MFDVRRIQEILPHRYPFLLIDRVLEVVSGQRAVALKNVTINEPFFVGHYPDYPVMPGVLLVEAMAQTAGIALYDQEWARGKMPLLAGVEKARFRKKVVPGDQVRLEATILRAARGVAKAAAQARVGEDVVAEAELLFAYA
ncbi:MAG: 3-hydroxyacyl-ACP dehydratase FabZ [Bacillota bacterium]|nr:3-hydroxyacyl-ACP dehydratase FabZ [Bacillota bacterium]